VAGLPLSGFITGKGALRAPVMCRARRIAASTPSLPLLTKNSRFPQEKVVGADGQVIFDLGRYDHIADDAPPPDTVNPSLCRQSQMIKKGGLYKVVDDLYQVPLPPFRHRADQGASPGPTAKAESGAPHAGRSCGHPRGPNVTRCCVLASRREISPVLRTPGRDQTRRPSRVPLDAGLRADCQVRPSRRTSRTASGSARFR
jgi:hypothetical protein